MKRKSRIQLFLGVTFFVLFILYTVSLKHVNVMPIGPNGSTVAYADINSVIHQLFGVHMWIYNVTDWAGVVAIAIALGFAILGLIQWLRRGSIARVDCSILLLGVFYIIIFSTYLYFEFNVINYRPILINGILEASYPSSTTMLALCILPTAMMQFDRLIQNARLRFTVNTVCGMFTALMVTGRLICGVHWFTDIFGGAIFSTSVVLIYAALNTFVDCKKIKLNLFQKNSLKLLTF